MSRLEEDAKAVLDPLVSGLKLQMVSLAAQRRIAFWATKTAMMLDLTQAQPILPFAKFARMRSHHAIPGATRIWMFVCLFSAH
jgi:hypothetical protein